MKKRFPSRQVAAMLVSLLAAATPVAPAEKAKKQAQPAGPATRYLVWPIPPEVPRIRWLSQITSLDKVRGRAEKKAGWMERVAGVRGLDEPALRLQRPYGIAVDSGGRIYVADGAQRVVFVLDRAQRRVERRTGSSRAPLALPIGVALDGDDRLFVSDSYLHSVTVFDRDGKAIAQFGGDKMERAAGLAIDRQRERLYVADPKAHRLAVFSTGSFAFERYLGGPSTPGVAEPGRLAAPANVAVDRDGNVYVTDTWNHRVQIFDPQGRFLRAFGTHGVRPGNFIRPKGIAVDSEGHIYVADAEFNNFQIFTPEGRPLMAVGSRGDEPGQFALIAGIFIDAEDRIFTSEQWQGRVQIFQYLLQRAPAAGKEVRQ